MYLKDLYLNINQTIYLGLCDENMAQKVSVSASWKNESDIEDKKYFAVGITKKEKYYRILSIIGNALRDYRDDFAVGDIWYRLHTLFFQLFIVLNCSRTKFESGRI